MDSLLVQIGQKIRAARKELGLTQENVAERTGLDWSFIGQIERGANVPSIRTLAKIADALNLNIRDLFPAEFKIKKSKNPLLGQNSTNELLLRELTKILNSQYTQDRRFLIALIKDISSHYRKKP